MISVRSYPTKLRIRITKDWRSFAGILTLRSGRTGDITVDMVKVKMLSTS